MSETQHELSSQEMQDRINAPGSAIIDVRPVAAYNGWKLQKEARGGHIAGARTFPLKWFGYNNWQQTMADKGIKPGMPVTVYGYTADEAREAAAKLAASGYKDVSLYNHFVDEWAAYDYPMDYLPRYKQLVYPEWVNDLLHGKQPEGYEGKNYVVCHSHYGYLQDYEHGHIPGAIAINTNDLEDPETWNRRPPEELRNTLEKHGIAHDTTVIVYGRFSHPDNADDFPGQSSGHLGAMRTALIMMYAGVKDVRILNGGLNAWQEEGYPVTSETKAPESAYDFGAEIPGRPDFFVDMPEARNLLAANDGELVSIRSWEEFTGNVSGYNYIGKTGRIPGAVFGNCGSDAYHMENYRNPDHTMREFHEVRTNWLENNIVPQKRIAFYCGTGWRGSEAFMNAYMMNWTDIAVFDGGWFEWSNNPDNPVETGVPEA